MIAHAPDYHKIPKQLAQQFENDLWDVVNREHFIETFNQDIFEDLKVIPFDDFNYLPLHSAVQETRLFETQTTFMDLRESERNDAQAEDTVAPFGFKHKLAQKLAKIARFYAKSCEIVIIGQREVVSQLLRLIRECEIIHPSVLKRNSSFLRKPISISMSNPHSPVSSGSDFETERSSLYRITSTFKTGEHEVIKELEYFECFVSNVVPWIDGQTLNEILVKQTDCERILDVEVLSQHPFEDDNETPNRKQRQTQSNQNEPVYARILFENAVDAGCLADRINSDQGIHVGNLRLQFASDRKMYSAAKKSRKLRVMDSMHQMIL